MRDLAVPADHQPLRRAGIKVGGQPRRPVLRRVEIVGIGEIADTDVRMVNHPVQVNHVRVGGPVGKAQRMGPQGIKWHGVTFLKRFKGNGSVDQVHRCLHCRPTEYSVAGLVKSLGANERGRPEGRPLWKPVPVPQAMIFDTTPAPTVRPPSRMAKRSFSSIAIGAISSTTNFRLSPGITISVPSGSCTVPVTSVVRK
jgi:hypothetical protein